MDDEYELISKEFLKQLKEDNKKLKEDNNRLKSKISGNNNKNLDIDDSKKEITNEKNKNDLSSDNEVINILKSEREEISKTLNEIRELNQRTLDNTLTRTEKIDQRLESMVDTMKELITNLSQVIEEMPNSNSSTGIEKYRELMVDMKKTISNGAGREDMIKIDKKLKDIEMFMTNLRVLLSYIKPVDVERKAIKQEEEEF